MEDIFAVDDADVQVVTRQTQVNDESHEQPPTPQAREPVSDYNFDYVPERTTRLDRQIEAERPFDLGLDEEVIVKSRPAQAKLDEDRLISSVGIPSLIKRSKQFKFRGKGHELQDLDKFIEHYQFWCHELFPKAKFRDCLGMIRKVGKTKRMKMHRREFIDDLLPKPEQEDPVSESDADAQAVVEPELDDIDFDIDDIEPATGQPVPAQSIPDDDDMDALEAMGVF